MLTQPTVHAGSGSPGRWLQDVAWPEAEALLKDGATAVLPIGAASKQHGLHLPMASDLLQAVWLSDQLRMRFQILVWPVVAYGYYPAFLDYTGSTTLTAATFGRLIEELLHELFRAGAQRVLVINTGISTIPPVEQARQTCPAAQRVLLAHVYRGVRYRECEQHVLRQASGGHADEAETSIMLAIAPDRVRLELAENNAASTQPGPYNRFDPARPNYFPGGASGNPTLASAEQGRLLLAAMLEDIIEMLGFPVGEPAAG